jgi:PAS domain-containing protein
MVTILLAIGLLLGLAAFCAAGWARASRRLATARRNEHTREQGHRAIGDRVRLAEQEACFGTWTWDPASEIFALSAGAAALNGFGNQPVEVTGAELYATVHPDDRAAANAARKQALANGGAYVQEFRRTFPDGSVRW